MLLRWFRRRTYTFGLVLFPVIFGIKLFIRFKSNWFHLQFVIWSRVRNRAKKRDQGGRRGRGRTSSLCVLAHRQFS